MPRTSRLAVIALVVILATAIAALIVSPLDRPDGLDERAPACRSGLPSDCMTRVPDTARVETPKR